MRIELDEINNQLESLSVISSSAIVLHQGTGSEVKEKSNDGVLIAYVVLAKNEFVDNLVSYLRCQLEKVLPDYMIPSGFIVLDEFPLTRSGKLNFRSLPEPTDDAFRQKEYIAPRNHREEFLCQVWQEILGIGKVSIQDRFFDLGGDSISIVRLSATIQKEFSIDLALRLLFENSTVETQAALISFEQKSLKLEAIGLSLNENDDDIEQFLF